MAVGSVSLVQDAWRAHSRPPAQEVRQDAAPRFETIRNAAPTPPTPPTPPTRPLARSDERRDAVLARLEQDVLQASVHTRSTPPARGFAPSNVASAYGAAAAPELVATPVMVAAPNAATAGDPTAAVVLVTGARLVSANAAAGAAGAPTPVRVADIAAATISRG